MKLDIYSYDLELHHYEVVAMVSLTVGVAMFCKQYYYVVTTALYKTIIGMSASLANSNVQYYKLATYVSPGSSKIGFLL